MTGSADDACSQCLFCGSSVFRAFARPCEVSSERLPVHNSKVQARFRRVLGRRIEEDRTLAGPETVVFRLRGSEGFGFAEDNPFESK